jgi:phosphoenolpyruvate carboxykinase (ATP)
MNLPYTRAMVRAVLTGALDGVPTRADPNFGFMIPEHVPDVPDEILDPRCTWADPAAYDAQVRMLVGRFQENFKQYDGVDPAVVAAGPAITNLA